MGFMIQEELTGTAHFQHQYKHNTRQNIYRMLTETKEKPEKDICKNKAKKLLTIMEIINNLNVLNK